MAGITNFCQKTMRHFFLFKRDVSPPVDLYLNFEKSSLTNWIFSLFRTGFLLCLCSLQKSTSKLIFAAVKNQVQMDRA